MISTTTRLAIYYGIKPHTARLDVSPDGVWRLRGESVTGDPVWAAISTAYTAKVQPPDGVAEMHLAELAAREKATATHHRKLAESAAEGAAWLQCAGAWAWLAESHQAAAQAATLRYRILTGDIP
jgi:hypothetical protein